MTPLLWALILWAFPHPPAERTIGSATLLEGSFAVTRGTTVYRAAEGIALKYGDIIETSDGAFAQLEFTNGAVVALGPSTRAYILPAVGSLGGRPILLDVVMLTGWLKTEIASSKGTFRFRTRRLGVVSTGGTFVIRSNATECDVFFESGNSGSLGEVKANGEMGAPTPVKAGQFFSRQRAAPVSSLPRPSAPFLDSMPRQYRDTLPARESRLSDKPVEAKAGHPVTYEEIEPWLEAPSSWRRGLAPRFASRLSDSTFRKQVENHSQELPDWAPILHPNPSSESPQVRN